MLRQRNLNDQNKLHLRNNSHNRHDDHGTTNRSILKPHDEGNNTSTSQEPIWIHISRLDSQYADDREDTFSSSKRKRSRLERGLQPWEWLFGFATITKDFSPVSSCGKSMKATTSNDTSPFGQHNLRKTVNSTSLAQRPSSTSLSQKIDTTVQNQPQAKAITVQDRWNTKFNGITVNLTPEQVSKYTLQANHFENRESGGVGYPNNLIELTHLHEPSLVQSLHDRYDRSKVYTFCGRILLALNPFCEIKNLYGEHIMEQYWMHADNENITPLDPHVYAITHDAFQSMIRAFDNNATLNGKDTICADQSILVSGESGAGKTVTTKIVMQYLATLSQHYHDQHEYTDYQCCGVEQQVLQSNPILESFGNARTIRNDNSSRFGKFIEIQFHRSGRLIGASIKTYLLEKVRLIRQTEGERNYHIFYEILSGLKSYEKERKDFGLFGFGVHDFRITASSGTFDRRDGVKDKDTFTDLRKAFDTVGFLPTEQHEIFQVVSGLLHMSNLTFCETHADASDIDKSNLSLSYVLDQFKVSFESLNDAICTSTITVGREVMKKRLSLEKAEKAMEALMKATYGALFDYIVQRINSSIKVNGDYEGDDDISYHPNDKNDCAFIKILDIFGFESFENNSFEQLCINYCNEALQQQFNKYVFQLEQQEYERENIAWSFISFPDNQDILDLIEKRHTGILSILDEQCKLAKCTDQSFANMTYEKCAEHPRFRADRRQMAQGLFSISHYAGEVEYSSDSFLNKNKDELPKEATDFLLSSSSPLIIQLGQYQARSTALKFQQNSLSRASVGNQFSSQLNDLRNKISITSPHYIRCLKPNDDLTPNNFVPAIIADQLRCAGVLEAVRVSRVGYPQRYTKDIFMKRYWMLGAKLIQSSKRGRRECCEDLIDTLVPQLWERQNKYGNNDDENSITKKSWQSASYDLVTVGIQLGRTKVFLRQHAFDSLELLRCRRVSEAATQIQSIFRGFIHKSIFAYVRFCIIRIQCCVRRYIVLNKVRNFKKNIAAIKIQSVWKGYVQYSNYSLMLYLVVLCQRVYRGRLGRIRYNHLLKMDNANKIQNWWRTTKMRHEYIIKQYIAHNIQQMYRKRKAREVLKKLRAEAKDLSKVASERDELKKAADQMRIELKAAEQRMKGTQMKAEEDTKTKVEEARLANNAGDKSNSESNELYENEIQSLRQKVAFLQEQLEIASNTPSLSAGSDSMKSYDELSVKKDFEIMKLRQTVQLLQQKLTQRCETSFGLDISSDSILEESLSTSYVSFRNKFGQARSVASVSLLDSDMYQSGRKCNQTLMTEINDSATIDLSYCIGSDDFDTTIHTAIRDDDFDALSSALNSSTELASDINSRGSDGKTPLHLAVLNSNLSYAKLLIENESVANSQDYQGNTPLHYAENVDMMELLLDMAKANPNIPNQIGFCAIHLAVQRQDVRSVECLMKYEANINAADDLRWQTPLHLVSLTDVPASEYQESYKTSKPQLPAFVEIAKLICGDKNADLKYQDKEGNTPLHYCCISGDPYIHELVSLFLKHGASPNIMNERGQTPIHLFLHNKVLRRHHMYHQMLHWMMCHGGNPNVQSLNGCTPLHLAIYHQDLESSLQLLDKGAQLHFIWKKPSRWSQHWSDKASNEVCCLDMVEDDEWRYHMFSAINEEQKWAQSRANCMLCKKKFGPFGIGRQHHCRHCGSVICASCSPNQLGNAYFPSSFLSIHSMKQSVHRVCIMCEKILVSRNYERSIMGREVFAIHNENDEDISFLETDSTFDGPENLSSIFKSKPREIDVDI